MIIELPWFLEYELWIFINDMLMKVPYMNMWLIWDIAFEMLMLVRHHDFGNAMILNTLVFKCAYVSHELKEGQVARSLSTCMIYIIGKWTICGMQDRTVWVTSNLHVSILIYKLSEDGLYVACRMDLYESPLISMLPYAWPAVHEIWPTGPHDYMISRGSTRLRNEPLPR